MTSVEELPAVGLQLLGLVKEVRADSVLAEYHRRRHVWVTLQDMAYRCLHIGEWGRYLHHEIYTSWWLLNIHVTLGT